MPDTAVDIEALRQLHETSEANGDAERMALIHPGEMLRDGFMVPLKLSAGSVAKALGLPRSHIERIVKEEIGISTDTALRLSRYFRTSHQFWLNLQADFESETLLSEIGPELDRIEPLPAIAA